ncbi:MAG: endonuclease III domain-containing protein [bacterium]
MSNKSNWIYNKLLEHYGDLGWWPGNSYEIMVGAVLVQNTAWGNVERSLANFGDRLTPEYIEALPLDELIRHIYPSGFYTAKAVCLKNITAWYKQYGYSVETAQQQPQDKIRKELLAIKGIGQETADAVLLYVFYFPSFVIDAYIKRLAERLSVPVKLEYKPLQTYFTEGIEKDAVLFGKYHILILEHGKRHCKKKPKCGGCPFVNECSFPNQQKSTPLQ